MDCKITKKIRYNQIKRENTNNLVKKERYFLVLKIKVVSLQ